MNYWNILKIIGSCAVLITLGTSGYYYLKSKTLKEKRDEGDKADDRLIVILQGTVIELEKKVDALTEQQKENIDQIQKLRTENSIITKILQGRDGKTDEMYAMIKSTMENTTKLFDLMQQHMNLTEKIVGKMPQA